MTDDEPVSADAEAEPVAPYAFDASHVTLAVEVLDRAFSVAERWGVAEAVRTELKKRALTDTDRLAIELARVPYWRLQIDTDPRVVTERVPPPGPPGFEFATPAVVELWTAIECLLTSPAARAVVADVLWERRVAPAATHARTAIDAHLSRAAGLQASLESTDSIVRAWDLSRRISDVERAERAEAAAIAAAQSALEGQEYVPGVTLPLLALLTSEPLPYQERAPQFWAEVEDLLERALHTYAFHHAGNVVALMRRLAASPVEIANLNLRYTNVLLEQAVATPDGLLKQTRLEEVIAVARNLGQTDVAARATAALQSIDRATLGLQRIQSTATIPIDVRESALDRYTRGRDWRDGLDTFLFSPPPTGRRSDLEQEARQYLDGGYIHTLFRRISLTREGLPSHTTDAGDFAQAVAHQAAFRVAMNGHLMATGLSRVARRFGIPVVGDIRQHLIVRGAADRDLADALARSIHYYWRDDFDAAVHVITPRIESASRSLLRELDVAIYRTQVGQSKGGYVGLYALIEHLERLALDPDWAYYLRHVLLGPHGMSLRDDVAHGLLARPDAATAALVLRAAALLILITGPTSPIDWDESFDGRRPSTDGHQPRSEAAVRAVLKRPISLSRRPLPNALGASLARVGIAFVRAGAAIGWRAALR